MIGTRYSHQPVQNPYNQAFPIMNPSLQQQQTSIAYPYSITALQNRFSAVIDDNMEGKGLVDVPLWTRMPTKAKDQPSLSQFQTNQIDSYIQRQEDKAIIMNWETTGNQPSKTESAYDAELQATWDAKAKQLQQTSDQQKFFDLKPRLRNSQIEIDMMKGEVEKRELAIQQLAVQLKAELDQKESVISQLKTQYGNLKVERRDYMARMQFKSEKEAGFQTDTYTARNSQITNEINKQNGELTNLQHESNEQLREASGWTQSIHDQKTEILHKKAEVLQVQKSIAEIQDQIEQYNSTIDNLSNKKHDLICHREKLQRQMSAPIQQPKQAPVLTSNREWNLQIYREKAQNLREISQKNQVLMKEKQAAIETLQNAIQSMEDQKSDSREKYRTQLDHDTRQLQLENERLSEILMKRCREILK